MGDGRTDHGPRIGGAGTYAVGPHLDHLGVSEPRRVESGDLDAVSEFRQPGRPRTRRVFLEPHDLTLHVRPRVEARAVRLGAGGEHESWRSDDLTRLLVVLQMAARLLVHDQEAGDVIDAPRFVLAPGVEADGTGFDTWSDLQGQIVRVEAHAPSSWATGLVELGHRVEIAGFDPAGFGHAQMIEVRSDGVRAGAADPRAMVGSAVAHI